MKIKLKLFFLTVFLAALFIGCGQISDTAPIISFPADALSLDVGDTFQLEAISTDPNLTKVYWTSSDSSVVTVKGVGMTGIVSAVSAGTTAVIASVSGYPPARILITVEPVKNAIYIAPWGKDETYHNITNPAAGSADNPYYTISHAQKDIRVGPGSTIYIRGGVYQYKIEDVVYEFEGGGEQFERSAQNAGLIDRRNTYFLIFPINKSGAPGNPIRYFAFPGDPRPVFDFSNIKPGEHELLPYPKRVCAFSIGKLESSDQRTNYIHMKGFDIVGVQVVIQEHTGSEAIRVYGNNNIIENITVRDGMATGFYISWGRNNLFYNCDAYNNWDTVSEGGSGENTDGFGVHVGNGVTYMALDNDPGNKIIGCRAWANSDDGFDCIRNYTPLMIDGCWAFYNGYSQEPDGSFVERGNGQGIKAGGWGMNSNGTTEGFPAVMPRHTIQFCISATNCSNGFDANYQYETGSNWYNNVSYNHTVNYNMQSRNRGNYDDIWSVPGYGHRILNNLSYKPGRDHAAMINYSRCTVEYNSWDLGLSLTDDDFYSVDITELTWQRKPDGSLPDVNFMRPKPRSKLIDAGIIILNTTTDRIDPEAPAKLTGQTAIGVNYRNPVVFPPASDTTWDADVTPYRPFSGTAPNIGVFQ